MAKDPATHYDVLNVSSDAPREVIDAAYRALSKKYHPDLNRNDTYAAARMAQINASYDVLSDNAKRYLYDKDLEVEQKRRDTQQSSRQAGAPSSAQWPPQRETQSSQRRSRDPIHPFRWRRASAPLSGIFRRLTGLWIVIFFIYILAHGWINPLGLLMPGSPLFSSRPAIRSASDAVALYKRPDGAPNGNAWPIAASYIAGYDIEAKDGHSEVTIDNSRNNADVFVKLYALDGDEPRPVRYFYIPKQTSFTLHDISPGAYDVRYKDLDSGYLFKTEKFVLREDPKPSRIKMTLYKVIYNISVNDF